MKTTDSTSLLVIPAKAGIQGWGWPQVWQNHLDLVLALEAGTYRVGHDIAPGIYAGSAGTDIGDSCYWERLSGASGEFDDIIANGNATGSYNVRVDTSDFALMTRCDLTLADTTPGANPPTVSMTISGTPLVRLDTPIPVIASFSKPVSSFIDTDIIVANGFVDNFVGSDGDSAYTFDVTPNAIGDVTVDIADGVATDADGNNNTAAVQLSLGIPYDDDGNGEIGRDEVITAIGDYLFNGTLIRDHVITLIGLYLFG